MSWVPSSVLVRAAIAAGLVVTATAATADILVIRATGPASKTYPAGRRLPDNALLTLRAGDQLIVLDGRGTRVIRGPGTFSAGAPSAGRVASAAPAAGRRARIGAVRGLETGTLRPPSIWHVDVARSSNFCVADPSKVTLWRADPSSAATLSIAGGGRSRQVAWQPGSSVLAWPSDLPVAEDAEYRLSGMGKPAPTTIRFRVMPAKPAGLEDMAQALIRNRCEAQLDLFIDTVKLPG